MASIRGLLYPESELSLVTLFSPEETRAALLAASAEKGGGWYLKRRRAGQRFVRLGKGEALTLERLVPYPDPWRPVLTFELVPKGSGTELKVCLRLSRVGRIVTGIWHGLALVVGLGALLAVLGGVIRPQGLILTALAALYAGLPAFDQRVERKATREALEGVLSGDSKKNKS